LAEPEKSEPVLFIDPDTLSMEAAHVGAWKPGYELKGYIPLYTAAPPRLVPLSDEQLRQCAQAMEAEPLAEGWPELIKFARALEAAHGITGEKT
jgi:hypothetical protein